MKKALAAGIPANETQLTENENVNCTFLTLENINHLKRMFNTKENYIKYMACLWVTRDLLVSQMNDDVKHPVFPLFDAINNLIGSLLPDRANFDFGYVRNGYVICNGEIVKLQDIMHYEFHPIGRR